MTSVNLRRRLENVEIRYITEAMRLADYDKRRAAKLLTISRRGLYSRMERLGLYDKFVTPKVKS
jgi:transcriptional regulator with PAS, ATPase and Fis domain